MPHITDMTLEQMRLAPRSVIIQSIGNWLDTNLPIKRALIGFLIDSDTVPDAPVVEFWPDWQVRLVIEVLRDAETGARISGRKTQWTYFASGEVRFIRIRNYDAEGNELVGQGLEIEHFLNGRLPISRVI